VAITIGIGAVLAMQAILHVNRIRELQEEAVEHDAVTLARAMASAVVEVWALGGPERAIGFVDQADGRREHTTITFRRSEDFERDNAIPNEPVVERLSTDQGWCFVASAPVRVEGATVGVLEISRRLPSEQEYFESILRTQVATTLAAAALSGLIALALGAWLVGNPIRRLSRLARKVADGDYSLRSNIVQADEIGDLAHELDAMVGRLEQSKQEVRSERHARTDALEKLRHADRLTTVGRLASSIAHELGTPLNIVSGRAAMISSDETVPEEARENARRIVEQSERMAATIRETLEFSRRKPMQKKVTPIGSVLEHAVSLLEPILDDKHILVQIDAKEDAIASIDAGKILQVLTNLMMNAMHAMPEGGTITLAVTREHVTEPHDRHAREGDYVRMSVQDEGFGIPEDKLESIFDAFATGRSEGTGLGLSVCKGIVREHGGWIEVQSEVGRGSQFVIYLPEREES
jgi:signal transduction histidine kinase